MLLIRMAKSPGKFRGAVGVKRVVHDSRCPSTPVDSCSSSAMTVAPHADEQCTSRTVDTRQVFLPYSNSDNRNSTVKLEPAYPGVFIYRFSENFNYINQAYHIDYLTSHIMKHTRRTQLDDGLRPCDRLWCDAPPTAKQDEEKSALPVLRAVVLDFSTVNVIDITSIQGLVDLRNTLDRYAAPALVEWHFAGVHNRWTRRALAFAGFGFPALNSAHEAGAWCPSYTVAMSLASADEREQEDVEALKVGVPAKRVEVREHPTPFTSLKPDTQVDTKKARVQEKYEAIYGVNRPFFHIDLHDAVDAAVRDATKQDERDATTRWGTALWSGNDR